MGNSVEEVLARLEAAAGQARASQDVAAAAARRKPRIADPGGTGSELDVPEPTSNEAYEFEKLKKPELESHGIESEVDLHSSAPEYTDYGTRINPLKDLPEAEVLPEESPRITAARDEATQVYNESVGRLKAKVQSRAMPEAEMAPSKSIEQLAQEDAERILGKKAMAPPEVGMMEGKPVESMVDTRGKDLASIKPEPTPEGKVLTTAEDAAQLQSKAPAVAEAVAKSDPAVAEAYQSLLKAGEARRVRTAYQSAAKAYDPAKAIVRSNMGLGERVAEKYGQVATRAEQLGKEYPRLAAVAAKGGKLLGDTSTAISDFNKASLLGKAWKATKLGWNVGKWGAETAMTDLVVPAAAEAIAKFGITNMAENLGATGRLPELPGQGTSLGTEREGFSSLIDAQEEQLKNLANYQSEGAKYGLKVTGRTGLASIMGVPFLNRMIAPGPNIKVEEDPTLKAAYTARNKQRIQETQEQWATNQAKGHSD